MDKLNELIMMYKTIFILFNMYPIWWVILGIIGYKLYKKHKKKKDYHNSTYYAQTLTSYKLLKYDKGKNGEYLVYDSLKTFEEHGTKFLFNVYVPKEDGSYTEIDVIMIHPKGIFIIESKNYSGWIYGSEYQKNWLQTFKSGQKEYFYNPVMQNKNHISCLRKIFGYQMPMRSIIAFSDRCELKDIRMETDVIKVVNRYNIYQTVTDICNAIPNNILSEQDIKTIYKKLYPYTQVSTDIREQHIRNIYR